MIDWLVNWAVIVVIVAIALALVGGALYGCYLGVRVTIEEIRDRRHR